jgi:hypothetical protein
MIVSLIIYSGLNAFFYNLYTYLEQIEFNVFKNSKLEKSYRIVNITKSVFLGLSSPYAMYLFYCILFHLPYNINILYLISSLYASLDMSAMVYNPHAHISTTIHHSVVQVFYLYGVYVNWNVNSISNLILIYAIFSTFAYLVNFRLGIRQSEIRPFLVNLVNDCALIIYVFSCIANWCLQTYFLLTTDFIEHTIYVILYSALVLCIAVDDVKLIKYLYHQSDLLQN